jgi:acyl-coenzyme A thioesterase PaaI-like protein
VPPADRSHAERVARMRAAAGGAEGPWAAKRQLAAALRELLARLPASAAPDAELRALVPVLRAAAERFAAAGRAPASDRPASLYAGMENFQDTGPIVGLSNPIAPPLEASVDPEAGVVRARARFSPAYEGAPGLLHGGILAAAFDELLGLATVFSGGPGMTRDLHVRYLRPTPILVDLHFTGRLDRVEGRRLFVSAEVEAAGVRTAEASGVFTAVGGEKFEQLAREREKKEER